MVRTYCAGTAAVPQHIGKVSLFSGLAMKASTSLYKATLSDSDTSANVTLEVAVVIVLSWRLRSHIKLDVRMTPFISGGMQPSVPARARLSLILHDTSLCWQGLYCTRLAGGTYLMENMVALLANLLSCNAFNGLTYQLSIAAEMVAHRTSKHSPPRNPALSSKASSALSQQVIATWHLLKEEA